MKRLRREALLADRHRRARRLVGGLGRVVAQQMGEFFERGKKVGKQPMVARVGILLRARLDTRLDTLLSGVLPRRRGRYRDTGDGQRLDVDRRERRDGLSRNRRGRRWHGFGARR